MRAGPVNSYLIEDETLTLVDAGLNTPESLSALTAGIRSTGRRLEDIELLLLTHGHPDHIGAAARISMISGARVAAHALLAPVLENLGESARAENAYRVRLMEIHGVEADAIEAFLRHRRRLHDREAPVHVDQRLVDGDRVSLGTRSLRVMFRPGHSWVDTVFVDEIQQAMWVGDHVLPGITTTAVAARPLDGNHDVRTRPSALRAYVESLKATAAQPLDWVFPGHGDPFQGHRDVIERRLEALEPRTQSVLGHLRKGGPLTARQIAKAIWPRRDDAVYLTLSVVLGHLDLLKDRGLATEVGRRDLIRFATVDLAGAARRS
jgi:glyoxylase-like metal-dependent hydrolase (beta-lactamase superfamily II)